MALWSFIRLDAPDGVSVHLNPTLPQKEYLWSSLDRQLNRFLPMDAEMSEMIVKYHSVLLFD
jgi:hypothetical protein